MINLLPSETKSNYQYARRNLALRGWVIALAIVLVGLGGLMTFGLLQMQQAIADNKDQVAKVQAVLAKEKLTQTESKVKEISSSLRLATQVLSNEILFSKLITQIGSTIPQGAVLASLNIDKSSGALDLNAKARDYTTASQVQVNLGDSPDKIFARADIVNINCTTPKAADKPDPYPCTITLRALFNDKNQFLFINQEPKV